MWVLEETPRYSRQSTVGRHIPRDNWGDVRCGGANDARYRPRYHDNSPKIESAAVAVETAAILEPIRSIPSMTTRRKVWSMTKSSILAITLYERLSRKTSRDISAQTCEHHAKGTTHLNVLRLRIRW